DIRECLAHCRCGPDGYPQDMLVDSSWYAPGAQEATEWREAKVLVSTGHGRLPTLPFVHRRLARGQLLLALGRLAAPSVAFCLRL
ncbi:unnamed protein product, partial [Symbiodinium sp. CCMP2456]